MTQRRAQRAKQRKPAPEERQQGEGRDRQRVVCYQLLER